MQSEIIPLLTCMAGVRLDAAAGRGLPERADSRTFLAASPAAALACGTEGRQAGRETGRDGGQMQMGRAQAV